MVGAWLSGALSSRIAAWVVLSTMWARAALTGAMLDRRAEAASPVAPPLPAAASDPSP